MTEEEFEIKAIDFLRGIMPKAEIKKFETLLESEKEYKDRFEALSLSWKQLDDLEAPIPSEQMDLGFYEMLYGQKEGNEKVIKTWGDQLQTFFERFWRPQLAYGIILLTLGVGLGYVLRPTGNNSSTKEVIVNTNEETEEVREKLVLTLLEQPSANKRLQGINEANKIQKVDETVIKALLETLNNDPNVNVRLAAIESLTNYLDNSLVREGLVQSIVSQESPIVQITLANLMVALQEKKSIEPFKKLIRNKQLESTVKKKLEKSIQEII